MAEVNVENMEENASLFMEKMGFAHDTEGLELSDDQLVNFLLLCHQMEYGGHEEEEMMEEEIIEEFAMEEESMIEEEMLEEEAVEEEFTEEEVIEEETDGSISNEQQQIQDALNRAANDGVLQYINDDIYGPDNKYHSIEDTDKAFIEENKTFAKIKSELGKAEKKYKEGQQKAEEKIDEDESQAKDEQQKVEIKKSFKDIFKTLEKLKYDRKTKTT